MFQVRDGTDTSIDAAVRGGFPLRPTLGERVPCERDAAGRPRRLHRDVTSRARQTPAPLIATVSTSMLHYLMQNKQVSHDKLPDYRATYQRLIVPHLLILTTNN